ncbi:hypothetical protein TWF694_003520 [Orbilia ellipsospora]|uniref:F-box domain-containing protein n=1 Tax=Orbilia ellipsospora TaxID=2528407 RepID=A0AAV9WZS3_9PEZI
MMSRKPHIEEKGFEPTELSSPAAAGAGCTCSCHESVKPVVVNISKPLPLLEFAPEILYQIMAQCDNLSLKNLRLTCHTTCSVASRILFNKYTIALSFFKDEQKPLRLIRPRDRISDQIQDDKKGERVRRMAGMDTLDNMKFLFENVRELHIAHYRKNSSPRYDDHKYKDQRIKKCTSWSIETFREFLTSFKDLVVLKWSIEYDEIIGKFERDNSVFRRPHMLIEDSDDEEKKREARPWNPSDITPVVSLVTYLDLYMHNDCVSGKTSLDNFKKLPKLKALRYDSSSWTEGRCVNICEFLGAQEMPFKLHTLELRTVEATDFLDDVVPKHLSKLHTLIANKTEPPAITYSTSPPKKQLGSITVEPENRNPLKNTIWDSLLRHSVPLRRLTVGSQSESLLNYLVSCTYPLEKLDIKIQQYPCSGSYEDKATKKTCLAEHKAVENFMTEFWERAIPIHKTALRYLSIRAPEGHCKSQLYEEPKHDFARKLNRRNPWGFTDAAKEALKTCHCLEYLQMGSISVSKVKEAIEFALSLSSLKHFKYTMGGFLIRENVEGRGDYYGYDTRRAMGNIRVDILKVRWDAELPERRWKDVQIVLVPLEDESWWVERDTEEETSGCWRLMDKQAIRENEEREREMRLKNELIESSEYETE